MFRASSAHLQEDTVVYMQHMVLSLCTSVPGGLSVHSSSCVPTGPKSWRRQVASKRRKSTSLLLPV